ncbi:MAG: DNA repair protein RadC [bacterium]|nr:DNA repair protein RadC [bacterium]
MKIKDMLVIDRPREKLIKYGVQRLEDKELIAILLGTGQKGLSVLELSSKILKQFRKQQLIDCTFEELQSIHGIGKTKACILLSAIELGKRLIKHKQTTLVMQPIDIWKDLPEIRKSKKEHFIVYYLDVRNQVIKKEIISIGTLNASLVHPREVFEPAIQNSAAQIIICHNHPSDDPTPSEEDMILTKRLIQAGEILGIEIIDHVVVSLHSFYSCKEHNRF